MERLFFAINLNDNIKNEIYKKTLFLLNIKNNITIVKKENFHITLKFLGNTEIDKFDLILTHLNNKFNSFCQFMISIDKLHILKNRIFCFPINSFENKLTNIFIFLEEILHKIGFEKEKRKFKAHITIARIKNSKLLKLDKNNFNNIQLENNSFLATGISLISSVLTPKGPVYSQIKHFPFKELRR